jgi:hypothetical protein
MLARQTSRIRINNDVSKQKSWRTSVTEDVLHPRQCVNRTDSENVAFISVTTKNEACIAIDNLSGLITMRLPTEQGKFVTYVDDVSEIEVSTKL